MLLHEEKTYKIRAALIAVRKKYGPGLKEHMYYPLLEEAFKHLEIPFVRQPRIALYSDSGQKIGTHVPDYVVFGCIAVEIKAVSNVPDVFLVQLDQYLKNTALEVGLLVNFGSSRLQIARRIYTNDRKPWLKNLRENPSNSEFVHDSQVRDTPLPSVTLRGFTLMEMLVALGLFSVIVVIAADLFLTFQRVSRKTESLEQVAADARFVVERIAREVREGTVAYDAYTPTSLAADPTQDVLHLRNNANTAVNFVRDGDAITLNGEALTSAQVRVRNAQFTVVPAQDPFEFNEASGAFSANAQPRVTIFLSLENPRNPNDPPYDVQTTISSRVYRR